MFPSISWTSFRCHSHGNPFRNLPHCFHFFHSVKMSPQFYPLSSYVFNYIFSLINFSNLSLFLTLHPYSVSTGPHILLNICLSDTRQLFTSRTDNVQVSHPCYKHSSAKKEFPSISWKMIQIMSLGWVLFPTFAMHLSCLNARSLCTVTPL